MHRGVLSTLAVALLLVTAGCAGSLDPTATANAQEQNATADGQTISVSASGQAEAEPNQAILRVSVVAEGDDVNAIRQQLAENVSQLRAALENASVSDDQIRTVAYNIDQRYYTTTEKPGRQPEFRGVHAFEITLSNVDRVGRIIDVAVSNGANRVDGVELTLSEERRREVRADALRDAMNNARGNADVLAQSANLSVTGVHSVSTGDVSFSPVRATVTESGAASDAGTNIESGPVTVSAQVQVVYNATSA
ncbi:MULTISPECIES: SIMPL domain-containing protein [Halorussus]|uniref:SIMPL domain-containing protein n=1 Tax=Halorussus TaxID=1070314 RepID=UPI00209ED2E5|nr:SIMPL domain-containing protein [Halorussus vallis]USZ74638.1 SIMPL domain-containing protein [Halorussus vallis]